MKNMLRFLMPALGLALPATADSDAIISLARSYLGTNQALSAVDTVTYKGTMESSGLDAEGETQTYTASIEIVFKKPFYHRIRVVSAERIETTALDDYEAWQLLEDPNNSARWEMNFLDTVQVRRLRANTWQNLSFFNDIESVGGWTEDLGLVTAEGQQLHKIAFHHGKGIVFFRCFDPVTGRLVKSETDTGTRIVETGENRINGVRFPDQVVTTSTRPDGNTQTVKVDFESVEVNDEIERSIFRAPSITRR